MPGKETDKRKAVAHILRLLQEMYPDATTALAFTNPLELLVATILSAQCTDERVNQVTRALFQKYRTAADYANADLAELEEDIRPTGFFRNKAKNLQQCCRVLVEKYGGRVPDTLEELVVLPGVGRKTANVVLGNAFGIPGITVDTHLGRVSRRLGLTRHEDPVRVEFDLVELIPQERWIDFSHQMIYHGRRICTARKPECHRCPLWIYCDYGQEHYTLPEK